MKCPKCNIDLRPQKDRGVDVEACPQCKGMWLTPAELNEFEDTVFDEGDQEKGSLFVVTTPAGLKCPVCSAPLKRFNYRFYDLELDCCPAHGFWLDAGEDARILELMKKEKTAVEREVGLENAWAKYMNKLRSPSSFERLKGLFK
jgi:Zn-finger nucleic acid-binding protein